MKALTKTELTAIFQACKTPEQVKKEYLRLMKEHHPDKGGNVKNCQLINEVFSEFMERPEFAKTHDSAGNEHTFDWSEVSRELYEQVMKVISIDSLIVEICGSWIWITGQTRDNAEHLHNSGFHFSRSKCAWYWHKGEFRKSRGRYSMSQIRNTFGSQRINKNNNKQIEE